MCKDSGCTDKEWGRYIAWANKEQYPGITSKTLYIDDFVTRKENDIDRHREMRGFMQKYFLSRNLHT